MSHVASLAAREYLMELEEALEGRMGRAERKLARRDVRSLVQDMAFRLAARKERPAPEDIDYELALEALRPPQEAAEVLAGKRESYARRKWWGRARKLGLVLVLLAVGALAVQAMQSQSAYPIYSYENATQNRTSSSTLETFHVGEGYQRLDYRVRGIVTSDTGEIHVTLLDPSNHVAFREVFEPESGVWARGNLPQATAGNWTLVVDYRDAAGSVRVEVTGIRSR